MYILLLMEEIRLTTWDVQDPVNTRINYLLTGAGFLIKFNLCIDPYRIHGTGVYLPT